VSDLVNRDAEFDDLYVFSPLLEACCRVQEEGGTSPGGQLAGGKRRCQPSASPTGREFLCCDLGREPCSHNLLYKSLGLR
jgi:hypothetical protein